MLEVHNRPDSEKQYKTATPKGIFNTEVLNGSVKEESPETQESPKRKRIKQQLV